MREIYQLELYNLDILAKDLLHDFKNGVVILQGDLAAGKTTFVKSVAKQLGLEEEVTSPTFSLQQYYGKGVFHYDIYNHGLEHFMALGMLEELEKEGLHFIEWGDDALVKILQDVGIESLSIEITKKDNDSREYRVCIH